MDLTTIRSESPRFDDGVANLQNQIGTVMLKNVPIVSLLIDGKERLCLAQISNTLLRDFTYNEIHNRRVALGITCIQCTPVQLEILRRAGAMPVSSRRCGMITKREAQRLVKSFLEEATPPQLPENFSFDVYHECGWGCSGKFVPSRYNSSRAKCIKCDLCNIFFSPNKFIFHCHKLPTSLYRHPDAANFNSWRRHLKLLSTSPDDDLVYAWEDVKAMFNGGSRRKIVDSNPGGREEPETKLNEEASYSPESSFQFPTYPSVVTPNPYEVLNMPIRPMVSPILNPEMDWRKYNDLLRMRMNSQYPYFWPRESSSQFGRMPAAPSQTQTLPVKKPSNTPHIWRGFLDDERKSPKLMDVEDVVEEGAKTSEKCSRKSKPRKCEVSMDEKKFSEDEDNDIVVSEQDESETKLRKVAIVNNNNDDD